MGASSPPPDRDRGSAGPRIAGRRIAGIGWPLATKANVLVLTLALLLGFAISAQVRQTRTQGLETLREDELLGVLDTVTQEGVRLGAELRDLERTRDRLASGADSELEAIDIAREFGVDPGRIDVVARERADTLGLLAGSKAATGPGVRLTIADPDGRVGATVILDAIEELRDAGAEVLQVGPQRVVMGTFFSDSDAGVSVSGTALSPPYVILAIGDPATMASAMGIPGGVSESVRGLRGEVTVEQLDSLDITAIHRSDPPRFATPAPTPDPSPTS